MNEDRGASIIDINFGCPVKKIVKKYAGSALMQDEDLATAIMDAVVKAVNIPVTMKTRFWVGCTKPECAVTVQTGGGCRHPNDYNPRTHA